MGQNPAKRLSEYVGRAFLRQSLIQEQDVLRGRLKLSASSITHNGVKGEVNEKHFIEILRSYLPRWYGVYQGIVIDSHGLTSDQIDIIIFNRQYTPPFWISRIIAISSLMRSTPFWR
jgi:hypothetical protein